MSIQPLSARDYDAAVNLLRQSNLPAEDISEDTRLFVLYNDADLIGVVGLEIKGQDGLLRSLCVEKKMRSSGSGKQLVDFIEAHAAQRGVKTLYLLTTTTAAFFTSRSYQTIDRNAVSQSIRATSEFASVCPASATVMKKELEIRGTNF